MKKRNAIGTRVYYLFNDVRSIANQAVHIEPNISNNDDSNNSQNINPKTALKCLKKIHKLAIWYHKAYCLNPNVKFEEKEYDVSVPLKPVTLNDDINPEGTETILVGISEGRKTVSPINVDKADPEVSIGDDFPEGTDGSTLRRGQLLNRRYRLLNLLGKGSFGITYIAEDRNKPTKPLCVIKQFIPRNLNDQELDRARKLFIDEAKVLEKLGHHSQIPQLFEFFEENDNLFLAQEYINGNTLRDEFKEKNELYKESDLFTLLEDILNPLSYLHENKIIHRDLKPENLIRRAEDEKIVIIDFGAVKDIFEISKANQIGTIIGTRGYMPPEQGCTPSYTFDIYAVGMIILEAMSRKKISDITSPQDLIRQNNSLSDRLKNILLKMIASNPNDRYSNANEVLDEIKNPPSPPEPTTVAPDTFTNSSGNGSSVKPKRKRKKLPRPIHIALGVGIFFSGTLLIKSFPYLSKTKLTQTELILGTIWKPESSQGLADYIENNAVPANYFAFLRGEKVKVRINGDRTLSYDEAKKRMETKQWDVSFATSPILSIFAKNQGYQQIASMFPGTTGYEAGLFVRRDSSIQSLDDIVPSTKVAFGSFDSASSFYMPTYDLYGKTVIANVGNRGEKILDMVKEGLADVGSAAIGDSVRPNDPELRIIHVSRTIPGSGVYVSPNLSSADQDNIKKLLLKAPGEIQEEANYEDKPEPDYTEFSKIVERVEEIIVCVDFSKNPVTLACNGEIQTLQGRINGISIQSNSALLKLSANNQIYNLSLPVDFIQEIFGSEQLVDIQGKSIELKTDQEGYDILINQPSQIKVLVE
ncbi:protein kinase domain-containing protein [Picosynechococcus sp. NKBG15041c]|uniref:protein kinase domain-containing protein n=1 Tax=Picosynechococcus sp. NKBG15041c TaxID=1407650 RepID=UPI000420E745|nr:protein kinase [Picosynechococcus sp. NKBG15041c]